MKTTRTKRAVWPLALLATTFLLGCQEQASSPTGPEGSGPLFTHKGADKPHGGKKGGGSDDDPTEPVTWSEADLSTHGVPTGKNTLQSSCSGVPGAQPSKPSVWWNDQPGGESEGFMDGCAKVTVTKADGSDGVTLTNDASLIVGVKKGSTKYTIQFQIQDVGGAVGIQYRTDKFVVPDDVVNGPFTGAGFTLHVHSTVEIWRLKGHTGGPKVEMVGTINIGDIVYSN